MGHMSKALKNVNTHKTVQTERADSRQVKNNAGGFVFKVSEWDRLERFLILGTDGGTYYVKQVDLTEQNVDFVRTLLKQDVAEVISRVVDVSINARAKSNSAALFVLALAMNTDGIDKSIVKNAVNKVARTATHLFEYTQYLENLGGWGRAKRESVANWYAEKSIEQLALQIVKYRQRNGWTHRDTLRLAHPKNLHAGIVEFALGKNHGVVPRIIDGFEQVQVAKTSKEVVKLIEEYQLPWETIPTQWHKDLRVWRTLFEAGMGQTALLRNTTRFAKLNAFDDLDFAADYAAKLADPERIEKGKVHPISYLNASVVFEEGQIDRKDQAAYWYPQRNKNWNTNAKVLKALQNGFYSAFKNVEPANKRTLLGVDISGSMSCLANGLELSCAQVSAAVAMQIARTEPKSEIRGFSSSFVDLEISESDTFSVAMRKVQRHNFGRTDCSLPMLNALEKGQKIDTFVVITDNETWAGKMHPFQALKLYRKEMQIDARLAVLGVAATPFTIADSDDLGMRDYIGFDSGAPFNLADFSAGRG